MLCLEGAKPAKRLLYKEKWLHFSIQLKNLTFQSAYSASEQ